MKESNLWVLDQENYNFHKQGRVPNCPLKVTVAKPLPQTWETIFFFNETLDSLQEKLTTRVNDPNRSRVWLNFFKNSGITDAPVAAEMHVRGRKIFFLVFDEIPEYFFIEI